MDSFLSGALLLITSLGNPRLYEYKNPEKLQLELQLQQEQLVLETKVKKIEKFLSSYNSPLAPYARDFVINSDNLISSSLLVGISSAESSLGKHIPLESYNPFGLGCTGSSPCYRFSSYPDAIRTLAGTLKNHPAYKDFRETGDVRLLSQKYMSGNRERWTSTVKGVMEEIEL